VKGIRIRIKVTNMENEAKKGEEVCSKDSVNFILHTARQDFVFHAFIYFEPVRFEHRRESILVAMIAL